MIDAEEESSDAQKPLWLSASGIAGVSRAILKSYGKRFSGAAPNSPLTHRCGAN